MLRIEGGNATGSGGGNSLPVGRVNNVTGSKYALEVGVGGSTGNSDCAVASQI